MAETIGAAMIKMLLSKKYPFILQWPVQSLVSPPPGKIRPPTVMVEGFSTSSKKEWRIKELPKNKPPTSVNVRSFVQKQLEKSQLAALDTFKQVV